MSRSSIFNSILICSVQTCFVLFIQIVVLAKLDTIKALTQALLGLVEEATEAQATIAFNILPPLHWLVVS